MKFRVLGCSGAIAAGSKTTSFLLDHDLLVDAGTGVGDLTLDELLGIEHIVISHSHLDHVASLALMADSVAGRRSDPIRVYALAETIDALRTHVFNGVIWPDFTQLPSPQQPVLTLVPIEAGQQLRLGHKAVEVLPAIHSVPAVGYAVRGATGMWVYTGDTERNPRLWDRVNQWTVAMLVIETAFSNREEELARLSKHLSPSTLAQELARLDRSVPVYLTHAKPGEIAAIVQEVRALDTHHKIEHLQAGQEFAL